MPPARKQLVSGGTYSRERRSGKQEPDGGCQEPSFSSRKMKRRGCVKSLLMYYRS